MEREESKGKRANECERDTFSYTYLDKCFDIVFFIFSNLHKCPQRAQTRCFHQRKVHGAALFALQTSVGVHTTFPPVWA